MTGWTTPDDLRAAVQREWDRGRLPRALLHTHVDDPSDSHLSEALPSTPRATPFPFRIPLRRPTARQTVEQFEAVREWAASLQQLRRVRVESAATPNRTLGPQVMPAAAWLDTPTDALAMIGRSRSGEALTQLRDATPDRFAAFVHERPLVVLAAAADWDAVLAVAEWILAHPDSGLYVRQVDLPGVHSKTIERQRRLIAAVVASVRDGEPESTTGAGWFERRYGFATKPAMIRFRQLDESRALLAGLTDITVPVSEFAALTPDRTAAVRRVFVTENEVNYLAFPPATAAIVVFGAGNEAPEILGAVGWLGDRSVHYWGDIDTHGFAILDRFRSRLPQTVSLLMDAETLLTHRDSWGREDTQVQRDLANLTDPEAQLYGDLLAGTFGEHVRLEQEFIRFGHAEAAIAATQ